MRPIHSLNRKVIKTEGYIFFFYKTFSFWRRRRSTVIQRICKIVEGNFEDSLKKVQAVKVVFVDKRSS